MSIKTARTNRIIDSEIRSLLLLSLLIFRIGLSMTPLFRRVLLVPFFVVCGDEARELAVTRRVAVPLGEPELPDSMLL